jgi:hypothetical protein
MIEAMEPEMEKYIKIFPKDAFPRLLAQYIHARFKCTKHISKKVAQELIKNNKAL